MNLLFLVFASLGFLGTPASGGGSGCGRKFPGYCRLHCSSLERPTFMCNRSKQCCVRDLVKPVMPPPIHRARKLCRTATKRQREKQPTATAPRPPSATPPQPRGMPLRPTSPGVQSTAAAPP
ncbi:beta-defensin 132 [Suricata suricatta]|uniref:Beta-defensin n=1 Tax=Suricata suricatta TaxID=37032 RepID=A0A673UCU5_SURSU|nr:beta-defensin 132 [Suricata suricatta]